MRTHAGKLMMGLGIIALAGMLSAAAAAAAEVTGPPASTKPVYLYKTTFIRAAQGKLLDLIALYKERMAVIEAGGDARPFWWRHTQGDHWDLMLLTPMGSYTDYYAKNRVAKRKKAADAAASPASAIMASAIAFPFERFVMGPPRRTARPPRSPSSYPLSGF